MDEPIKAVKQIEPAAEVDRPKASDQPRADQDQMRLHDLHLRLEQARNRAEPSFEFPVPVEIRNAASELADQYGYDNAGNQFAKRG